MQIRWSKSDTNIQNEEFLNLNIRAMKDNQSNLNGINQISALSGHVSPHESNVR